MPACHPPTASTHLHFYISSLTLFLCSSSLSKISHLHFGPVFTFVFFYCFASNSYLYLFSFSIFSIYASIHAYVISRSLYHLHLCNKNEKEKKEKLIEERHQCRYSSNRCALHQSQLLSMSQRQPGQAPSQGIKPVILQH